MVNRQLDVLYDKNVQRVVLRRFTEQGAAETFLKPQDVVAARRTGDVPADLSPTRVALVGNKSVVFDVGTAGLRRLSALQGSTANVCLTASSSAYMYAVKQSSSVLARHILRLSSPSRPMVAGRNGRGS